MTKTLISNVRGPQGQKGDVGPQGPPGPNTIPTYDAIRAAIQEAGPARVALQDTINEVGGFSNRLRQIEEFLLPNESLDPTRTVSMHAIFQRAIDALGAEYQSLVPFATSPHGFVIAVPAGHFRFNQVLIMRPGVGFRGQGMSETFFYHAHTDAWLNGTVANGVPLDDQVVLFPDITLEDFTIDGALQPDPTSYDSKMKGIFAQSLERLRVSRVQIRNTLATAFGFDYIKSGEIANCIGINAGRGHYLFGDEHVGSGSNFGLGSGLYAVEAVTFRDCLSIGAYTYGYFIETVRSRPGVNKLSRGIKFINCRAYENWIGFLDAGGQGAAISGCDFSRNHAYGFSIDATHAAPFGGIDGSVADTIIEQNGPTGSETHSGGGVLIAKATQGGYTFGDDVHIRDNVGPGFRFTNEDGWAAEARFTLAGKVYRNLGAAVRAARSLPPKLAIERMKTWLNTAALEFIGAYTAVEPRIRFNDFGEASTISQTMSAPIVDQNVGLGLRSPSSPAFAFDPAVPSQGVLAWRAPLETVDDYKVEWLNVATGVWTTATRTASISTTQTITGLPNFAQLQFRVSSIIGGVVVGTPAVTAVTRLIPKPLGADYFNRADQTLDGKSLPDGSSTSFTWVDVNGAAWSILSTSIRPNITYANSVLKFLVVNTGSTSGTMRVQYTKAPPVATDISKSGAIVRWIDANNYVTVDMTSAGVWQLRKNVVGVGYTTIIPNIGAVTVGDLLMVQWSGNSYTVTINDNAPASGTDTGTTFTSSTWIGLVQAGANVSGGGSPMKWDNFEFWPYAS